MSYPVRFEGAAIADVQALPERQTQFAAIRVARDLTENPHLGEPLRNRFCIGDLNRCRAVQFDNEGRRGKPRYRLVNYNDPDDGSIAVVRVIAVGLRAQLEAFKAARHPPSPRAARPAQLTVW